MKKLSSRTQTFTDSVIRRMTRVSLECGAVNLSQGFPDFDPPGELLERLASASVCRDLGRPGFPRGALRQTDALYGSPDRSGQRDRRDLRLDRGHDVRHDDRL